MLLMINDKDSAMRLMGLKVAWFDENGAFGETHFLDGFTPNEDGTCIPHVSDGFIKLINNIEHADGRQYRIICHEMYEDSSGVLLEIARSMFPHLSQGAADAD